ncbi:MAG: TIGR03013 family XrtA/PEP-CTERM system glycosyltransferase [Pseudomonadota bacterium]
MPHIRIFRHYLHTPYLMMAASELVVLFGCAFLGFFFRNGYLPPFVDYFWAAALFASVQVVTMVAMGVYESRIREGYTGMMLRTAVAMFLLGSMLSAVLSYFVPSLAMGRGVLMISIGLGFALIAVLRWGSGKFLSEDALKRTVLVLGCGHRAMKIATRMRRRSDRRAFRLFGFARLGEGEDLISQTGANVIQVDGSVADFCRANQIHEIVVAMDERRRNREASGGLPLDDLLDCRLSGIDVCDIQSFVEREAGKLDVDLVHPSWMVFSDGFITNSWRSGTKRAFDVLASLALLALVWPIMLLTAIANLIDTGRPILYRQTRVGLNGKPFNVLKFRSMVTDAEAAQGAVWAEKDDPRITRVGAIIRKTRIDELPQLFNVLRGDMSFVGPRPERPEFVTDLSESITYYDHRHRVKPGITGWAQLCYPYGASVDDSKEKLQYDLYYLKNHSILLDMIILLQTVEVVLIGDGAR